MKKLAAIFLIMAPFLAICQSIEVDQRLIKNLGVDATTLAENNPEYYKFLLYELDNAYFITSETPDPSIKQEIRNISTIKDTEGNPFNEEVLANPSTFNFKQYNFKQAHDNRVLYLLSDGRYLVFFSLKEVKANYKKA